MLEDGEIDEDDVVVSAIAAPEEETLEVCEWPMVGNDHNIENG